jgi:DNA-binding IclR family transcriptional regulator
MLCACSGSTMHPQARSERDMTDRNTASPVESVDRALVLLTALHDGATLSVKDAAARLDVAPSTAYRLLASLVYRGFAIQDRDRRYQLGPVLATRPSEPLTPSSLRMLAHPILEQLHDRVGETVQLMVLHRRSIRFLDGIECELPLRVGVRIGDEMPAHCSAGGKAMLAALSNADLDRLYQQGVPAWPTARYTDLPSLKRHLARVRRAGHGANHEETEQGVSGIGMAIRDERDRPVAAITVAIPSARYLRERIAAMLDPLADATAALESRLRESADAA